MISIGHIMANQGFRIAQLRVITCLFCTLWLACIIKLFTCYGEYDYAHIPEERLQEELYRATSPQLVRATNVDCNYDQVLSSTSSTVGSELVRKDFLPTGIVNGSYSPAHCHPAFSVAILVTYRNRQKQLDVFLPYIHDFLRKQNIHYKIYVIEQQDSKPWNKGLLYNVGARRALADQFPCLVLHDVDLLPLDASNLHACTRAPRHMSASLDQYRYVLPYDWLVGGVLALRADQFVLVDGFSNRFLNWGGEDDNFARRLAAHRLHIVRFRFTCGRFPRSMSRYTMLPHAPEPKNPERCRIMEENRRHADAGDGYRAPPYTSVDVRQHRLFTLLRVNTYD